MSGTGPAKGDDSDRSGQADVRAPSAPDAGQPGPVAHGFGPTSDGPDVPAYGAGTAADGTSIRAGGSNPAEAWVLSLLRRHEAPLLRYACRLTGDVDRARDVVQETFVRLCGQSPAELDGHAAAWLYTVCRRRALDVRRKERRMSVLSVVEAEARQTAEPGPHAVAEGRERGGRLMELLAALPDRQQEVVVLKYQGGLSYAEIAGVMGTNVNNVGVLMHKAMTTLRKRMIEMEGIA